MFEINQNDQRTVRAMGIDYRNLEFQEEYARARDLWKKAGFVGGLYNATLFDMALRYQEADPVIEPVTNNKKKKARALA